MVYEEVKPFLEWLTGLEQRLRAQPGVVAGTVRVATVYSVGLHTLPSAIKRCLAVHPGVNVRLSYRRTDEVSAACLAGEVDFGIVALPARRRELGSCRSATTTWWWPRRPATPSRAAPAVPSPRSTGCPSSASTATFPRAGWSTRSCAGTACG